MKIRNILSAILVCTLLGLAVGCGKTDAGGNNASTEQQLVTPEIFQRATERIQALIKAKQFDQAKDSLKMYDGNKQLSPEQQKVIDSLKAQITAN